MTDDEKLEAITSCFIHGLFQYRMEDVGKYKELAKRLAVLIDTEIRFQHDIELNKMFDYFWGPNGN